MALGVGFLAGLLSSPGDMRVSADHYYDESRMYDARVLSTLGLTEDDLEAVKAVVEKFTKLISDNGEVESVNEWGVRKLAYPIQDLTEGYYVLVKFTAPHEFPAELSRLYNINDSILRSLVVKCEQ